MQYAFLNFLCAALVPVLGSDVTAGAAGNVHCRLVAVSALRAFPDEFAVFVFDYLNFAGVTTFLAAVALGVEFSVHDVFVDVLEKCHYSRNIVFHVRNFYIADCSTW